MIEICVQDSSCFIYNIKDWEILRTKYRIIGEILGNNFCIPSLPLQLLPEEAITLKRKGIANFVNYEKLKETPSDEDYKIFSKFKENLTEGLKSVYRKVRKNQIENVIDNIVRGKRKKGDTRSKDDIFEEELNKSCEINEDTLLWPIFCCSLNKGSGIEVSENVILSKTTSSKIEIFSDLWDKGYYITAGNKFGGDFLLYLGDPIMHHAVNIIRCIPENYNFHPSELVAFSRLGTSVKKRATLATINDNQIIRYITLNWLDT
ncbi:tRNA intron endonuclease, catalytic C-terminal domain [Popillia japonica]|uniref:tRNA-intron lyase n=1 Tax=Popillia japonica TaxID=7064 RepID=A0AAW1MI82_POPJA